MTSLDMQERGRPLMGCLVPAVIVAVACCSLIGCHCATGVVGGATKSKVVDDEDLLARVRLGMKREEVERILDAAGIQWGFVEADNTLRGATAPRRANIFALTRVAFVIRLTSAGTVRAVEKEIALMEKAKDCVICTSGMAALSMIFFTYLSMHHNASSWQNKTCY